MEGLTTLNNRGTAAREGITDNKQQGDCKELVMTLNSKETATWISRIKQKRDYEGMVNHIKQQRDYQGRVNHIKQQRDRQESI